MTIFIVVLSVLLVLAAGSAAAYFQKRKEVAEKAVENGRLQSQLAVQNEALQDKDTLLKHREEELHQNEIERVKLLSELNRMREREVENREELEKLQASFRAEFKNMANDIMEEKSRQFKMANKESMDMLLKPFKDNIAEFRERVEKIYASENEQHGALKNELRNLMELNKRITQETTNLTQALKGNSKVQGDWGEGYLETILEQSNLRRGIHYTVQENLKGENGQNLRPDVILNLPEGKRIVIDSKVSLSAYVDYVSAEDDSVRKAALERHVASVRKHITELAGKSYQDLLPSSPDFTIMFIPTEPAFMVAMQSHPELWGEAYDKKIIISSLTSLFALLKIVDDLWKRDSQSRNALEIAQAGGRLYDKFVGFVESMQELERNLKNATGSFDKAMNRLSQGNGNLIVQCERLQKLGVKSSKQLPKQLRPEPDEVMEIGGGESAPELPSNDNGGE